ncbi:MAG: DUF4065 domain-containing protein [Defluviitaleaceae bacterium]|nr:DUF4065 domain-containing protein [Defluviitaleaceae bacterium]
MVNSLMVSNNILQRAERDEIEITPMKLQKLLYLVYARYLYLSGTPLFLNKFEVWQYGPVEREVYEYFKNFRWRPINNYAKIDGKFLVVNEDSDFFRNVIDEVWLKYRNVDAWELSDMTHGEGTAWKKMREISSWIIGDTEIREDGKRFFEDVSTD